LKSLFDIKGNSKFKKGAETRRRRPSSSIAKTRSGFQR